MDTTLTPNALMAEQDKRITETISRERVICKERN